MWWQPRSSARTVTNWRYPSHTGVVGRGRGNTSTTHILDRTDRFTTRTCQMEGVRCCTWDPRRGYIQLRTCMHAIEEHEIRVVVQKSHPGQLGHTRATTPIRVTFLANLAAPTLVWWGGDNTSLSPFGQARQDHYRVLTKR